MSSTRLDLPVLDPDVAGHAGRADAGHDDQAARERRWSAGARCGGASGGDGRPSWSINATGAVRLRAVTLAHWVEWPRSAVTGYFRSAFGSFGSPSTRSPTMLRWIWDVPPQMVSERLKKNVESMGLTL